MDSGIRRESRTVVVIEPIARDATRGDH